MFLVEPCPASDFVQWVVPFRPVSQVEPSLHQEARMVSDQDQTYPRVAVAAVELAIVAVAVPFVFVVSPLFY